MKKLHLKKPDVFNGEILTREQLKGILGGVSAYDSCNTSSSCSVYDTSNNTTYPGYCGFEDLGAGSYICECVTSAGPYTPPGGTSKCYSA